MTEHLQILVSGKVQKVGFRYYTRKTASSLGICGFVQNRPDGSVLIEAEGSPEALSALLNWCHRGPDMALVESVKVSAGTVEDYQSFEIR